MYPYSNIPQGDNPNPQGAYPPPPYQNPSAYYRPQPPLPQFSYSIWRIVGIIALVWFVMAVLFGHHLFWPLVVVAAIFFFTRPYRWGGYRWHYGRHYYRRQRYNYPPTYYYPDSEQPGYYPPQSSQPQPPTGTTSWPAPGDETRTDRNF